MKKPILPTEIVLRFHPSKFLWGWWWLFSMAVLSSVWLCLPVVWAIAASFIYVVASVWQWTQLVATRWRFSPQTLRVDVFGEMSVTDTSGQRWLIKVLPDSVVHHGLIVLHIDYLPSQPLVAEAQMQEAADQRWRGLRPRRLLILFDQADAVAQKSMRVWLKWGLRE
ncbi:hypothetical protein [Methylophilus sp.]|uniref:hypothetical protein n=1 Tax=Methylophilus sp. TaxID=29541 RepID=UPI004035DB2C